MIFAHLLPAAVPRVALAEGVGQRVEARRTVPLARAALVATSAHHSLQSNGMIGNGQRVQHRAVNYRVTHLVANLGWVDLDFGSSAGQWPLL